MSSGYSTAQLEAMRAERLRQELNETIKTVKEEVRNAGPSVVGVSSVTDNRITVFAEDDISGGVKLSYIVDSLQLEVPEQTQADKAREELARKEREELDFSGMLLAASGRRPSRSELEIDDLIKRVNERPVITENDASARKALLSEISAVMADDAYNTQAKADLLKIRIESYLMGGRKLTRADELRIEDEYLEYCALCTLLGMQPVETLPYRVECEIRRMSSVLEKRRQNEYIMEALEEIMEELGCHVREEAVLDNAPGQLYTVDGSPMCDVFVAVEGNGIMFEPIAESRAATLDSKRKIESNAATICSLYDEIDARAASRGIILKRVYQDPPSADTMCVQSDVSKRKGQKRHRKALKMRAIGDD